MFSSFPEKMHVNYKMGGREIGLNAFGEKKKGIKKNLFQSEDCKNSSGNGTFPVYLRKKCCSFVLVHDSYKASICKCMHTLVTLAAEDRHIIACFRKKKSCSFLFLVQVQTFCVHLARHVSYSQYSYKKQCVQTPSSLGMKNC